MNNKTARQDLETVIRVEDLSVDSMRKLRAIQDWLRGQAAHAGVGAFTKSDRKTVENYLRYLNGIEAVDVGHAVDLDMERDFVNHLLAKIDTTLAQGGQEVEPVPFVLGNQYQTLSGEWVRFVEVRNEGSDYETMVDESGVNRYSRRRSCLGRVTARATDYPGNVPPLYTHPQPAQQGHVPDGLARLRDSWRAYETAVAAYKEKVEEFRAEPLGDVSVREEYSAMHEAKLTAIQTLRDAADAVDGMLTTTPQRQGDRWIKCHADLWDEISTFQDGEPADHYNMLRDLVAANEPPLKQEQGR